MLDAIGRRERLYQLLRGVLLCLVVATVSLTVGALLAFAFPDGWLVKVTLAVVLLGNLAAVGGWIVRPLVFRPRRLAIARLVETRVGGVHNALTNSVLLSHADDLADNPWTAAVLEEVAVAAAAQPLHQAVRFSALKRHGLAAAGMLGAAAVLVALAPSALAQGLRQLTSPRSLVAQVGQVKIVEVRPGDATIIRGQSLEIAAAVEAASTLPTGRIVLRPGGDAALSASAAPDGRGHYGYRIENVQAPLEYRLEIGDSRTGWFRVQVASEVTLTGVTMSAEPPEYTGRDASSWRAAAAELHRSQFTVLQGSRVTMSFAVDVPVASAMLQVGDGPPAATVRSGDGLSFSAETVLLEDAAMSLLLLDSAGQIVARVPPEPLVVKVTADAAPAIEMKWPGQDLTLAPTDTLRIEAKLRDDYGVRSARVRLTPAQDVPMSPAAAQMFSKPAAAAEFSAVVKLQPQWARHGESVWLQVEATDNRDLAKLLPEGGPQAAQSRRYEIRFRDPKQSAAEDAAHIDRLRQRLTEMLRQQEKLHGQTPATRPADAGLLPRIKTGQADLRTLMQTTAERFEFTPDTRAVQKTLLVLAGGAGREAVEVAQSAVNELVEAPQAKLLQELRSRQRRVIQTLESLLAMLRAAEAATQPTARQGGDLSSTPEALKDLGEALKEFIKEERRILDGTTSLAKKPVDNFDDADKKLLEELQLSQDKLDAFMQQKIHDFSNVAEQDMANSSLLRELLEVYSEVTMAKEALKDKAVEIAVAHEDMGLELAAAIETNLEKWLSDKPDRQKWAQEDQIEKTEAPMPELPKELEDMVGELLEQQEDLFEEMEDTNANWHDSPDRGVGWDAVDGPIDSMAAKGVTGNVLPNQNAMGGRSGEGRSGQSQGEMVEETATGKGGRNTPTRLDPTPFQKGEVKDTGKDPVGGATGGGKISGQGGAGLEGPVAPKLKQEMERLAQKQAELRNRAERLNLKYQVGRYDQFKLLESIAIMRRVEADLKANRYQNALRRRDIALDAMDTSRTLLSGSISVEHDSTPAGNRKLQQEIGDAMKGRLPDAWGEPLKEYYRKLASE